MKLVGLFNNYHERHLTLLTTLHITKSDKSLRAVSMMIIDSDMNLPTAVWINVHAYHFRFLHLSSGGSSQLSGDLFAIES